MSRKLVRLLFAAFVGTVLLGWATARYGPVNVANAQNCGVAFMPGGCLSQDSTMAGVVVNHVDVDDLAPPAVTYVEPDNTDSWQITALYSTEPTGDSCACEDYDSSVTADVTWTGTNWSVTCSGCSFPSGPILSVDVCSVAGCATGGLPNVQHGWSYRLVARVKEQRVNQCGLEDAFIRGVTFTTTAVDDGDKINAGNCTETSAASPTSQTWSATDFALSCNSNCSSVGGPTIDIIYDE